MMKPGPFGPVEPQASIRELAGNLRQLHVALVEQGFSEDESLRLVEATITASFGSGSG